MRISNILRRIPIIKDKIREFKPLIQDVLYKFFTSEEDIVFFDIGANTGQTIDQILRIYKNANIYSFEPTPDIYGKLCSKYTANKKVRIENLALSDKDEEIDFFVSDISYTNSCLKPNIELFVNSNKILGEALKSQKKIKVKCQSFDKWYNDSDVDIIDIMKIDTQGFEYNVINGGLKTLGMKCRLLYFEVQYLDFYHNTIPFYKIYELLYNNGFYYYCQISSNRLNNYQVIENDVLFVNERFFPYQ